MKNYIDKIHEVWDNLVENKIENKITRVRFNEIKDYVFDFYYEKLSEVEIKERLEFEITDDKYHKEFYTNNLKENKVLFIRMIPIEFEHDNTYEPDVFSYYGIREVIEDIASLIK